MMQPLHHLREFKPTALAYAISSLFITAGLAPLTAQAACTISGSVSTCISPFDAPYRAPAAPSPTLNINGVQTFSGQAEWLFSIDQASNLSTINFDSALTWNNIDYKLVTTPPSSLVGGAINIGNTSEKQAVSGSIFFESTANSSITLNLLPTSFNANEPVALSSIILNGNGSSESSTTTARINGNLTINDVDHGNNLTRSLYGATIRNANANADIINTGIIKVNGAQQSNAFPTYYGLESQSYNASNYTTAYRLNNSGTISVTLPGTSGYTAKALDIVLRGAQSEISIENSGTIELTSTSAVADVRTVNISNDTASNAIYFKNTSTGKITNTFSSVVYPNNSAIKYEGPGSFFLTNEGTVTSHIYTSSSTASTDSITNSGSITGNINTYDGNDTFTNTAGSVSGLIDLGLGDDSLSLSGGTLQNVQLNAGNDTSAISGGNAQNIDMGAGNDSSTWSGGGFVNHYSGDGADTFTITGPVSYALIQTINGDNASGPNDGSIDTLIFKDYTGALDASKIVNWEAIQSGNNSQVTLNDNVANPTSTPTEYTALAGGSFIVNNNFPALNANLTTQTGGSYIVGPGSTPTTHTINGNVSNAGTLNLANNTTSSSLTITGDYVGNNGILALSTVLDDDNSPSNKLFVTGAATGSTSLALTNMGGKGEHTNKGILLVQTGSSSANAFTLPGQYISVGAYDYSLVNYAENNNSNWYLTSAYVPPTPPGGGGTGGNTSGGGNTGGGTIAPPPPPVSIPVYSPNLGSMLANQRAANTLFRMRLEDREGAAGYQQNQQLYSPWVRYYSVKNEFDSVSGQLHTYGHNNAMQAGITLLSLGEQSRLDAGLMLGYADYNSRSKNKLTQRKSTSGVHGYSVGAYATWYANPEQNHGTYVDTWALWNHFDNNTSAADGDKHKYKSSGALASVEVGTDLGIGALAGHNAWLQPQAQLVYHGVTPDHFRDKQGVKIDPGHANYEARLGIKAYLDIQDEAGADYRPYLALNWIHNTDPYHVEIDDKDYKIRGMGNIGEVKLGLEGKLNANNQVWLNTFYAKGGSAQKEYGIDIGWQYNF